MKLPGLRRLTRWAIQFEACEFIWIEEEGKHPLARCITHGWQGFPDGADPHREEVRRAAIAAAAEEKP